MAVSNKISMNARFAKRLAHIHKAKRRYTPDESGIHIYRVKLIFIAVGNINVTTVSQIKKRSLRPGSKEEESGKCAEKRTEEADAVKETQTQRNDSFKARGVG
jgi:hypothetical protein